VFSYFLAVTLAYVIARTASADELVCSGLVNPFCARFMPFAKGAAIFDNHFEKYVIPLRHIELGDYSLALSTISKGNNLASFVYDHVRGEKGPYATHISRRHYGVRSQFMRVMNKQGTTRLSAVTKLKSYPSAFDKWLASGRDWRPCIQ
jgi:hypothetical protein